MINAVRIITQPASSIGGRSIETDGMLLCVDCPCAHKIDNAQKLQVVGSILSTSNGWMNKLLQHKSQQPLSPLTVSNPNLVLKSRIGKIGHTHCVWHIAGVIYHGRQVIGAGVYHPGKEEEQAQKSIPASWPPPWDLRHDCQAGHIQERGLHAAPPSRLPTQRLPPTVVRAFTLCWSCVRSCACCITHGVSRRRKKKRKRKKKAPLEEVVLAWKGGTKIASGRLESTPAKRPRALRKGSLTSKLERFSLRHVQEFGDSVALAGHHLLCANQVCSPRAFAKGFVVILPAT
eukprot:1146753-Pelagomonas_calceolata.AAC.2